MVRAGMPHSVRPRSHRLSQQALVVAWLAVARRLDSLTQHRVVVVVSDRIATLGTPIDDVRNLHGVSRFWLEAQGVKSLSVG